MLFAVMLALFVLQRGARAEDSPIHGFIQGNYSADTDARNPDNGRLKWSEERGQLRLDATREPYRLFIKTDVFYDNVAQAQDVELREGYVDLTGEKWDARAGRQIITWGVGDLIFINDVFPKDYEAFFSGRPMEYLKKGVDGVKAGLYPGGVSIEAVAIPFFEPNNLPDTRRFWLFDPMPNVQNRVKKEPASTPRNTELAIRAYGSAAGFDASLYAYKGWHRNPSMRPGGMGSPARITLVYPELRVYGGSLQKAALDGVMSLEAGYYDSRDGKAGQDPLVPNSQARFLAGYQRQLREDLTLGVQYYGERMMQYSAYESTAMPGFPKEPRYRQVASLRLTQLLMHQNLRLQWFSFYGITDRDYLLNPEARYNFTDNIWAAVGAMIFGGAKDTTQFGSLDRNDNAYMQVRYEF